MRAPYGLEIIENCIACAHREERLFCPTVTGTCYELTGDVIEPAQANFISRNEFLNFLKENGEAALRVAQQLGETYHAAVAEMRTIGLAHSAGEKLARFLLEWAANYPEKRAKCESS
jgi:hypothetical protein